MGAATGDILISDGGVRIARSNALNFVRTDNQSGTEQTLDNRLLADMSVMNVSTGWNYFQKFKTADTIRTQIATIHTVNSFKIYNFDDDSLKETITVPAASHSIEDETYGTVNFYNFNIDTALYGGYYYVIATINTTQTYRCEPFIVSDFTSLDGIIINYYNDTVSRYYDGIYYSAVATPSNLFRLKARLFTIAVGQKKSVYTGILGRISVLKGQPLRYVMLELSDVPGWVIEKINIALNHDHFFINNKEYTTENLMDIEHVKVGQKGTLIYTGSVQLQDLGFEQYNELSAVAPSETNYIVQKGRVKKIKIKGGGFVKHK